METSRSRVFGAELAILKALRFPIRVVQWARCISRDRYLPSGAEAPPEVSEDEEAPTLKIQVGDFASISQPG
jgi:hypothetical protein